MITSAAISSYLSKIEVEEEWFLSFGNLNAEDLPLFLHLAIDLDVLHLTGC